MSTVTSAELNEKVIKKKNWLFSMLEAVNYGDQSTLGKTNLQNLYSGVNVTFRFPTVQRDSVLFVC